MIYDTWTSRLKKTPFLNDNVYYFNLLFCVVTRCAYLPFLMNGQIERNADNTKMVFSCNDGYELKGESTVHCVDAVWDKKFPTCKGMYKCPNPIYNYLNHSE